MRLSSDHSLFCWCCFILFLNCKLYSVSRARLAHKTNSHWSHTCESKTFEVRIGVSLCMINREGESRKRWRRSQVRLIHGWLIRAFYGQARNVVIQGGVKIGIDQEMKTPAKSMEHVICVTIWYARPALQIHIRKFHVKVQKHCQSIQVK